MIPSHLLRSLTLQTRTTTTDTYGAVVVSGWTDSTITGRIDQQTRKEATGNGREGEESSWRLFTNSADVSADDRVKDGGLIFDVIGRPWPVYSGSGVHHYEATLRLVIG